MSDSSVLIEEVLQSGDFAKPIGLREDDFFDAKSSTPYDFTQPNGQYDLAKDVSSFANARGGWILVGLKHRKLEAELVDVVDGLDLLAEVSFAVAELSGRIRSFVYPEIVGLECKWVASTADHDTGLGALRVPPQSDDAKPFLIKRVVEGDTLLREIVFGYAERSGDSSTPLTVQRIQKAMRTGMGSHAQRLGRMEDNSIRCSIAQRCRRRKHL
jgi:hypothetical protein